MTETPKHYRVVGLTAENFQIIKAISITPGDAAVIEISGENGAGKTSLINSIWAVIGGAKVSPEFPIRKGEKEARVSLDLGDLKATRRWWYKDDGVTVVTDLRVESADGARYSKPQDVMSAIMGRFALDPLAFTLLPAEEQYKTVRPFVSEFDFEKMEGLNKRDYDDRTDVNREVARLKAEAAGINVPDDVPALIDAAGLEAQLANAATHNAEIATRKGNREAAAQRVVDATDAATRLRAEAAALITQAEEHEGRAKALQEQIDSAEALPDPIDVTQVQADLAKARETNAIALLAARREELLKQAEAGQARADALSAAIEARKADAAKAIAAAKMPIDGLGFGDGVVLLDDLPFSQASSAKQLRASIAIAAALAPRLRVIRVQHGVFLSKASKAIVEEFARENDFQIWLEVLEGGPGAIVIEEGEVRATAADEEEGV